MTVCGLNMLRHIVPPRRGFSNSFMWKVSTYCYSFIVEGYHVFVVLLYLFAPIQPLPVGVVYGHLKNSLFNDSTRIGSFTT